MQQFRSNNRFEGLEGVRALMAVWVVVGHIGNFLGYNLGKNAPVWLKIPLLTNVPVNIFVILSGFVIFEMLKRRQISYGRYLKLRAARILPIYFVALSIACTLFGFRWEVFSLQPWRDTAEVASASLLHVSVRQNWYEHVVGHILLVHGLVPESVLPNASQSLLGPAWSLSLEWQFYLFAPLIFVALGKGAYGYLLMALAFCVLQLVGSTLFPSLTSASITNTWGYFFVGWSTSLLLSANQQQRRSRLAIMGYSAGLGTSLLSILWHEPDIRATAITLALWVAVLLGCCWPVDRVRWFRNPLRALGGFLAAPWLRRIGESSYSLYLLHVFVLEGMGYLLIRTGLLHDPGLPSYLLLLFCVLPASLLVARISFRFIEKPCMEVGRGAA